MLTTHLTRTWLEVVFAAVCLSITFSYVGAQSFDSEGARRSVVRVVADGGHSIGSGSIIKVQGTTAYVLTAYHVIQKDVEDGVAFVDVELYTEEKLRARISQRQIDERNDIAILQVDKLPASVPPEIRWGYSVDLRDLDKVYAVGHPGIEVGWHITDGTVSRIGGGKIYFSGPAVSSKNSGGPLLNERGEMVGTNLRLDQQGVAIQEDITRAIIDRWVPSLPPRVAKSERKPEKAPEPLAVDPPKSSPPPQNPPPSQTVTAPVTTRNPIKNSIGIEFVRIPAGEFRMGSENWHDAYPHQVKISRSFYLSKYEVTQEQWQAVMGNNPSSFKGDSNLPVETVSWNDVKEFVRKLNDKEGTTKYRLPSEAEWEYAARSGGKKIDYSTTSDKDDLRNFAWYAANSNGRTQRVGRKRPNSLGLYDMSGNVSEWVEDCWHEAFWLAPKDGSAWVESSYGNCGNRVIRGGSWSDEFYSLSTSIRFTSLVDDRSVNIGFRLAQDLE